MNNAAELVIFDSNPLIQLHTQEAFSTLALRVYREAGHIGACNLVLPEIAGATGAMLRDKRITRAQWQGYNANVERQKKKAKAKPTKWPDDFPVIEPTKPKPPLPKPIKLKPGKKTSIDYVREQRD